MVSHNSTMAGMTREEEMFFKETKLPVRLAAAAYSSADEFNKLPIFDSSAKTKEISTKLVKKICPETRSEHPDGGLADWMLDIRVHMAIIPVEMTLPHSSTDSSTPALPWDLALIFRGTQPYSVTNWITDFTFEQEPVEHYILRPQRGEMLVHRGFHRAFMGVIPPEADGKDSTIDSIKDFIEERRDKGTQTHDDGPHLFHAQMASALQERPRRILSIGHSLGGALATLGAAWCKTTLCRDEHFRGCDVQCITLGSPRVGNPAFARAWDRLLRSREGIINKAGEGKSYRIVNALDVVPSVPISVPLTFEFQHVGMPVYLLRVVENWDVQVWPCLGKERPKSNTGSPIDHVQWHYTGAMVEAEATVASATVAERETQLRNQNSWWFLSFAKQLKPCFMWNVFKRMLTLDLSLLAHFWVLLLSWGTAVSSFLAGQAVCWLGLFPLITMLLPALSVAFLVDGFVAALLLPFNVLFGSKQPTRPRYKFGNFSLAVLSLVVMVIAYVAAWLGL